MPLRSNPITRALRTYNSALYAARATVDTAKKAHRWLHRRTKPKNPVVSKIRSRTRGPLGASKTAYSRETISGQARRDALAKKLRKQPRPKRTFTGRVGSEFVRKPYSGKIEIGKNMTGAQVKRNIVRHQVKNYTKGFVKQHRGNRVAAARDIKAQRNASQTGGYSKTTGSNITRARFKRAGGYMDKYVKAASRLLSRKG